MGCCRPRTNRWRWMGAKWSSRASTITQQLAKNMFRVRSQYSTGGLGKIPVLRLLIIKSKEWIIAVKLETVFSKKSLSEIAMTYGYIYVAQIALGANMNQAVKAIAEAEAYPGPSLIIGYAPCELHGVKGGMTNCQNEMKKAVEAGYWNLFTFNPANKAQGKNPFTLTSKAVDAEKYQALLANETRYSRLTRAFPDRAKQLFARNEQVANDRYEHLTRLVELYK